jgi:hypothetical protein
MEKIDITADVTFDMENLHIGTSYTGVEDTPDRISDPVDESLFLEDGPHEYVQGIDFDGTKSLHFEMDIAQKPQTPPLSWAWGGFPQKANKNWQQNQEKLRKRQSTPVMSARSMSPDLGSSISVKEKVDSYLSALPPMQEERKIAIEQEQTEESMSLMLYNDENSTPSFSLCGPITDFQKFNVEVHHIHPGTI